MLNDMPILAEFALLLLAALRVLVTADMFGLNPIPGWLLIGTLLGPALLGWVQDRSLLTALIEAGGALLLFTIGVELRTAAWAPGGRRALAVCLGHPLLVAGGIGAVLLLQGLDWQTGAFTATLLTLGCGAVILPHGPGRAGVCGGRPATWRART